MRSLSTGWRPKMSNPRCSLRALLTDQCDCMGAPWCNRHDSQYINDGYCERILDEEGVTPENLEERACQEEDHYVCGGRGWLPKDGVDLIESWETFTNGDPEPGLFIPFDWLGAEDD